MCAIVNQLLKERGMDSCAEARSELASRLIICRDVVPGRCGCLLPPAGLYSQPILPSSSKAWPTQTEVARAAEERGSPMANE